MGIVKKHNCKYCKEEIFRHRLASHYIKHHIDEIKNALICYTRAPEPIFPFQLNYSTKHYICSCCYEVWEQKGRAVKHAEGPCSHEKQVAALWTLFNITPPVNPVLKIVSTMTLEKFKLSDAEKDYKTLETNYQNLKIAFDRLQAHNFKLRESSSKAIEAKNKLEIFSLRTINQYQAEKLEMVELYIPASSRERFSNIKPDDDDCDKQAAMLLEAKYHSPNHELPSDCKFTKPAVIKIAEPAPEPVPEPLHVPVVVVAVAPPPVVVTKPYNSTLVHNTTWNKPKQEEAPKTICHANHNGERKSCTVCKIKKCVNNDEDGCYLYPCSICKVITCKDCYSKSKGTKAFCSIKCINLNEAKMYESCA